MSVGETVEEAFYYIHNLVLACEIQVRAFICYVIIQPAVLTSNRLITGSTLGSRLTQPREVSLYCGETFKTLVSLTVFQYCIETISLLPIKRDTFKDLRQLLYKHIHLFSFKTK